MRIVSKYSHLNGYEWLLVHQRSLWKEIAEVIDSVNAEKHKTKISREKTKKGQKLYSPTDINSEMKRRFSNAEWSESRTQYWVTDDYSLIRKTMHMNPVEQKSEIESAEKRPIYSYNQTDFVKNKVAVEVQFGKYAFIAYDLFVKHLAFYVGDQIEVGVEILPMKSMQEHMSSGPGYFESALYDIARQGRGVPSVPLVIVGVAP